MKKILLISFVFFFVFFVFCINSYACSPQIESVKLLSCNEIKGIRLSEEECNKCTNREMFDDYCVLKKCPEVQNIRGKQLWGCGTTAHEGSCFSCDSEETFSTTEEICHACNRIFIDGFCYPLCKKNEFFHYKPNIYNWGCSKKSDWVSDNRLKKTFKDRNKVYYSCALYTPIKTTKKECDKCPNRKMVGEYCVLIMPKCKENQFLATKIGECIDCDTEDVFTSTDVNCAKCSNRRIAGEYCALKCKENQFLDYGGECIDCEEKDFLHLATETECAQCSNRKIINDFCVLAECGKNKFHNEEGRCIDCDDLFMGRFSENPRLDECARCSNREIQDGECVLKEGVK